MAGTPIDALPTVPSALLTDIFPAVQAGVTVQESLQQVVNLVQSSLTGAALTRTNDTNVTLTLGGSPTTALLNATSLTLGWTGLLAGSRGGTGVNNGASTITIGGNVTYSGAFTFTGTLTNNTAVTFPTSGTLATTSQIPTGAALTKVDDTNVTLTLGGSPTTALVNAASITAGWTGQLGLTRGGTNASLTASNGGIVYSTASAMAILSGTATANLPLLSGLSAAPTWGAFALSLGGTLTTAGAFTMSGAFPFTGTLTGSTSVTFPTSGTLATIAQIPTGAALTEVDDTNVTMTLGGSPTTALLAATSMTLGWTGQLSLTRGGTAASLVASNGGIVYSTASAMAILAGTATAGQILRSGASAAPTWSTATYPATTTINQILFSSAANVIGGIAAVNGGVLVSSNTGVPSMLANPAAANRVLLSANAAIPAWSTAVYPATTTINQILFSSAANTITGITTANNGKLVTSAAGVPSITTVGGLIGWTEVTGTSQTAVVNNGYICNNVALVTVTLPSTATVGQVVSIRGSGAGGWKIAQNASGQINVGTSATTAGVGGSVASSNRYDCVDLICITANNIWVANGIQGNLTIV